MNPLRHIDGCGFNYDGNFIIRLGESPRAGVTWLYFRNPRRDIGRHGLLAGPLSNLLFACATLFIYGVLAALLGRLGGAGVYVLQMVYLTAYLSLAFAVFNLIPIPPLDGSKALFAFLPDKAYAQLCGMRGTRVQVLAACSCPAFRGSPLSKAIRAAFQGLFFFAEWGYRLLTAVA